MPQTTTERLLDDGFRGSLEPGAPLAPRTTWKIGGTAEWLAVPVDTADLILLSQSCRKLGIPQHWLGNGSNLLIDDAGLSGVTILLRNRNAEVRREGTSWEVDAGASFPVLAKRSTAAGLAGLEFGAGIPGTLGGALTMNAGWHEYEIGNHTRWVETLAADGSRKRWSRDECEFTYRNSLFRREGLHILRARIDLEKDDPNRIGERLERFATGRKENQPTEHASCGSVFLKPPGDFAGRLIEAAGLKGARVGGIEVSTLHANFFINRGGGRSADVLDLVRRVEREVNEQFDVRLEREFIYWKD
jgi:UDP-N-acetylmuramate dehydrogenase